MSTQHRRERRESSLGQLSVQKKEGSQVKKKKKEIPTKFGWDKKASCYTRRHNTSVSPLSLSAL